MSHFRLNWKTLKLKLRRRRQRYQAPALALLLVTSVLMQPGCFTGFGRQDYYGRIVVPRSQNFRWSNGGLPQTFDPAYAVAPPDTDLIRAIFEGLTDYDPRTLAPIPGVATRWEPSDDGQTWTFYLRPDARWSNGEPVTALDFVRSWQRTVRIGELAPHTDLMSNIVGVKAQLSPTNQTDTPKPDARSIPQDMPEANQSFGATAISEHVLEVRLERPDMSFPSLVSHPVFRPVKLPDKELTTQRLGPEEVISNGAFALASREEDEVLLERADYYWDKRAVNLNRVHFVSARNAEEALAAYREGEIDALTNAAFEPLAIKLLTPYKDFRRETYGALNYYSFNVRKAPFDDVRVREAMALAIDRERISQDNLAGSTEPAKRFLPDAMTVYREPVVAKSAVLEKDIARAMELLAEAGFPDGEGFPTVRLLINRNEQQRLVARSIAAMWRSNLNIETEIIIKNWDEYEAAIRAGDYDLVRRGVVMQTTDELTNMRMMFRHEDPAMLSESNQQGSIGMERQGERKVPGLVEIESEAQALNELRGMPIYFASSSSLVKPYVRGFDTNVFDAPSLKHVRIETNWKPSGSSFSQSATWFKRNHEATE